MSVLNKIFHVLLIFIVIELLIIFYAGISQNKKDKEREISENLREYNRENFEDQFQVIKELQPLMEEIRAVMKGEIQAESGTPLAVYSYNENSYKDVDRIEAYAELVRAELNGDEGRIFIEYDITYYDIDGNTQRGSGALDQEFIIQKDEKGNWKIERRVNLKEEQ